VQKPWFHGSKFGFSHPKDQEDKILSDKSLVLLRALKQKKSLMHLKRSGRYFDYISQKQVLRKTINKFNKRISYKIFEK
jgi:hypothetical protein